MPLIIIAFSYLLGSIPTAYIAGRLTRGIDIRTVGDYNVGAQNAFRQLGAAAGVSVFLFDAAKGILIILIAQASGISQLSVLAAGTATVIGHNWPVFLGFRGGRGEATTIGILLAVITLPAMIAGSICLAVLAITKDVIKASAAMFVPLPLLCWWFDTPGLLVTYAIWLPCLVAFTHYIRVRPILVRRA
jgi:glycerol-3-phosphate acyltransferase PlsY